MPSKKNRAWLLSIPLLLLLMFWLLRVVWITHMRPDEGLSYLFTRFDITYAVNYLATSDIQAPLWLVLFWIWRHVFVGDTEFAGRMLSLFFSMITLALVYRIGRDWFGKARYGLFAAAILGANVYFCIYALEIRPYALVMLLATLSMWVFERWLRRKTWRLAAAYGVVTALMFYVHYFLVFLVLAQIFYFLFSRPSRRLIEQGVGAGALAFGLWLPWLPSFLNQANVIRQVVAEAGNAYAAGIGTPSTTQPTSIAAITNLVRLATNGLPLVYGVIILLGVALLWRSARFRLALVWGIGVPVIALAVNLVIEVYTPRYVTYLTIGLALVLGATFALLRRPLLRNGAAVVFVAINLAFVPSLLPVRVPFRDLFRSLPTQPGDVVYFTDTVEQFMQWQIDAYLSPDVTVVTNRDLDRVEAARRIWFMTGDWFDEDVQAQFAALEPSHPVQTVVGQCPERGWCYLAQLMEAPPLAAPVRFGDVLGFWGVDMDSVMPEQLTVRLWWRVEQPPELDYSIGLQLLSADGALVAQQDGPLVHYGVETLQTSQLQPGRIYIDWRTLDLPAGLPSGDYTLVLVVYQPWDGARLLTTQGDNLLMLTSITIP